MQDGDHVQDLLHEGQAGQHHLQGVQLHPVRVYQVPEAGRQLCPVRSGAHVGGVPVLCLRGPPQDPNCHVDHHLQQNFGEPQQYVEICTIVPHYTGRVMKNIL